MDKCTIFPIDANIDYFKPLLHGKWEKDLISEINYANDEEDSEVLIRLVNKINKYTLINYVIEYLFHDIFNNVIIDIEQMIDYDKDNLILNKEDLLFYQQTIKLDNISPEEILNYYNKYKNSNVIDNFYDNITKMKSKCTKDLTSRTTKIDESKYDKTKSLEYGVPVYYYDGNPFTSFTRCTTVDYTKIYDDSFYLSSFKDGYSFSYITERKLHFFRNPNKYVSFIYNDINPEDIMHVYHGDSFSDVDYSTSHYVSRRTYELFSPEKLLLYTMENQINEVVVKNQGNGIKPTALLLIDTGKDDSILIKQYEDQLEKYIKENNDYLYKESIEYLKDQIEFLKTKKKHISEIAKKLNVPIIMLDGKKYKYSTVVGDDYSIPQTYIRSMQSVDIKGYLGRRS